MYRHLFLSASVTLLAVLTPITVLSQPAAESQLTQTEVSSTVQFSHYGSHHGDHRGGHRGCW